MKSGQLLQASATWYPVSFHLCSFAIALMGCCAAPAATWGNYNITYTDFTTPTRPGGGLYFTSDQQQAGADGSYAMIWNGPAHTPVSLHPANMDSSVVLAVAGNQQAGAVYSVAAWGYHAAIWSGTQASFRDLNPSWSSDSMAIGTSGTQQAGYATAPGYQVRAGLWSGTAASFVDLHPSGASSSQAYAIGGNQQAGMVNIGGFAHAAIWSGTAASFRDLNPAGARSSEIWATTGSQQAGWADGLAGIWFGTPQSFGSLHPAGATYSKALATIDSAQAGYAVFGTYRHALLWFGAADEFVDLQFALGPTYRESEARSIWTDGSTILVAGQATDFPGRSHPVLWELTVVPEPGIASLMGLALMIWAIRKRARREVVKSKFTTP